MSLTLGHPVPAHTSYEDDILKLLRAIRLTSEYWREAPQQKYNENNYSYKTAEIRWLTINAMLRFYDVFPTFE